MDCNAPNSRSSTRWQHRPLGPGQKPAHMPCSKQTPALLPTTVERASNNNGIEAEEASFDSMVWMDGKKRAFLLRPSDNGMSVQSAQPHARFPKASGWITAEDHGSRGASPLCKALKTGVMLENCHRHFQGKPPIDKHRPPVSGIHTRRGQLSRCNRRTHRQRHQARRFNYVVIVFPRERADKLGAKGAG